MGAGESLVRGAEQQGRELVARRERELEIGDHLPGEERRRFMGARWWVLVTRDAQGSAGGYVLVAGCRAVMSCARVLVAAASSWIWWSGISVR
jgi:hypothetical protein